MRVPSVKEAHAILEGKWRAFLAIKEEFDAAVGGSIYDVLPDVVGNTFGSARSG